MWFLASAAASFLYLTLPPPVAPPLLSLIACPEETELANRSGSNYGKRMRLLANIRSPFPLHHFFPFNVKDTKATFTFGFFPPLTWLSLHFFQARNVRPWKCALWLTLRVFRNCPAANTRPRQRFALFSPNHIYFSALFF
ncbi:uncharacterized protein BDZ83DRAFT_159800 [Colletotrichum acutatum]|uniref:Secreted protein n=1 Tax=Glomerella acutata TaxID=27357 RepID=A0AAD8XQ18_GLOAC|nr:uncharacterized protein BDZ83DRAFT_159800 [Colletotrichum acutatum]KAK1731445.1 hypothetical protein BDZ83DRAFT_159800 [Colletotrichum acutatum]